ncbi:uncharacterized protein LOC103844195 isoform X2 [Brassica rapa]|uniref:uncharacterized protein LOC103844195 isoform X2 n=1 Tax=Brassica campestris TaxID=3711 RepID=UPI00142D2869|nr:uncharacterized protein LOC103844195 isoform X2 [Brassica rapa]
MAVQAGVQTSKVLILLGAGVSGSIVLRHGRLSDLIAQLQELLKGAEGVESTPYSYKYDSAALAAQIRQLANEIKELSMINPVTIFNGDSNNSGYASYLVPAAAVGAMGYCYMWWKGWSFSDAMFVTKKNMANAVESFSKQLNDLSETLASTKKHLSKELSKLDWKVEEQTEISKMILNDVTAVKSSISQLGYDFQQINEMISGIEGKIDSLESKQVNLIYIHQPVDIISFLKSYLIGTLFCWLNSQDVTLSGLWHLCQIAGVKDSPATKVFQGLRFLTEGEEGVNVIHNKPVLEKESPLVVKPVEEKTKPAVVTRSRVHRAFPGGISWAQDLTRQS